MESELPHLGSLADPFHQVLAVGEGLTVLLAEDEHAPGAGLADHQSVRQRRCHWDPVGLQPAALALARPKADLAGLEVQVIPPQTKQFTAPRGRVQHSQQEQPHFPIFNGQYRVHVLHRRDITRLLVGREAVHGFERIFKGQAQKLTAPLPGSDQVLSILIRGIATARLSRQGQAFTGVSGGQISGR